MGRRGSERGGEGKERAQDGWRKAWEEKSKKRACGGERGVWKEGKEIKGRERRGKI